MITIGDRFLIGTLLILSLVSVIILPGVRSPGACAVVEFEGGRIHRLDVSIDREISVSGPLGETVVQVRDGGVRVKQSPCPHKICVAMGFKNRVGDVIACIPNRIVVSVVGGKKAENINGITR